MTLPPHYRRAMQWLIVAICAVLAILFFLAAFIHRQNQTLFIVTDWGRRQRHLEQKKEMRVRQQVSTNSSSNTTTTIMRCNGLENLCDMRANEIVYATLHNANSAFVRGSFLVKNHYRAIIPALQAGYRGINLDFGICNGSDEIRLVHGTCYIQTTSLTKLLTAIVQFLNDNPNEVLIFPTQLTDPTPLSGIQTSITVPALAEALSLVRGWNELMYNHPGPGQPWPTLRQLIQNNTRILFFHYNGGSCTKGVDCPYGIHPYFRYYAAETDYSFPTVSSLQDDVATSCQVTRGDINTADFFGINVFVTPARKLAAIRVTNQASFLEQHIASCSQRNNNRMVNLILVNYWDVGDLVQVVQEMNAKLQPNNTNASIQRGTNY